MTRETKFRQSLESQLVATSSWPALAIESANELSPGDFPCFTLLLGETKYYDPDSFGNMTRGEQQFTLRHFFRLPRIGEALMWSERSDKIELIENFLNFVWSAPSVDIGENYRLDTVLLDKIAPPVHSLRSSRFTIEFHCRVAFSFI